MKLSSIVPFAAMFLVAGCSVDAPDPTTPAPAPEASAPQASTASSLRIIPASASTTAKLGVTSWKVQSRTRGSAVVTFTTGIDSKGQVVERWWGMPGAAGDGSLFVGDAAGGVVAIDPSGKVLRSTIQASTQARWSKSAIAMHADLEEYRLHATVPYDACDDAREDLRLAAASLTVLGVAVAAACLIPEPVEPIVCVAAIAAYAVQAATVATLTRRMERACAPTNGGGGGGFGGGGGGGFDDPFGSNCEDQWWGDAKFDMIACEANGDDWGFLH